MDEFGNCENDESEGIVIVISAANEEEVKADSVAFAVLFFFRLVFVTHNEQAFERSKENARVSSIRLSAYADEN